MPIGGLGFGELVLIFAVLLLLFGAKRLPELASGMGRGIRDFKRAMSGLDDVSIQANQNQQSIQAPQATPAPQIETTPAAESKPEA